MNRLISQVVKRGYGTSVIRCAEASAPGSAAPTVTLNLCTPHQPIYVKKAVNGVLLPGEGGYFGILPNKGAVIAQLKPGQMTIYHVGGDEEKYFIPGGFAVTTRDSVTDISVPEAYLLTDFDETEIRKQYAEASKKYSSSTSDNRTKAEAYVEVTTLAELGRTLGLSL